MRSTNSIKNAVVAIITNIITILVGFVAQRVFVNTLGTEYLGINGLFTNIISMLSIVELGLGTAIIYSLYDPIAKNDTEKVKTLMLFYKTIYRVIAVIILVLGIGIIPFLKYIVGQVSIKENIILIYVLFLIDTVASYLLTYKRSILYANQKSYIINLVHIGYILSMNIVQIIILIYTGNYIAYLLIKIFFRVLENVIITIIANKRYSYINDKKVKKISDEMKSSIFTKVKGLAFHKIAEFVVLGTDNIIISSFLGVVTVGLYSNYNMIIKALNNLLSQVFNSLVASVGNLLVEKDQKKSYKIYRNMLFLNSWMFCFAATGILCIMEPFVTVWIGKQYILPVGVLIVLVVNFYVQGMRRTSATFKEAAGIYYEDRFIPLLESLINIIASIILVKKFGLMGVFMGTIISTSVLFFYTFPVIVYKKLFNRNYIQYLKDYIPYIFVTIFSVFLTYIICRNIVVSNAILQIIINLGIVVIIPNVIHLLIFWKTNEFLYYKKILNNFITNFKSKN